MFGRYRHVIMYLIQGKFYVVAVSCNDYYCLGRASLDTLALIMSADSYPALCHPFVWCLFCIPNVIDLCVVKCLTLQVMHHLVQVSIHSMPFLHSKCDKVLCCVKCLVLQTLHLLVSFLSWKKWKWNCLCTSVSAMYVLLSYQADSDWLCISLFRDRKVKRSPR